MSIQQNKYSNLLKMIEKDDFYNAPEIIDERKKLYNLDSLINEAKKNMEIRSTREKIMNKRSTMKRELSGIIGVVGNNKKAFNRLYPEIQSNAYHERAQQIREERNNTLNTRKKRYSVNNSKDQRNSSPHSIYSQKSPHSEKKKVQSNEKEYVSLNKEYADILENDCNLFMTQMGSYKTNIDTIKSKMENNEKVLSKYITKPEELKLIGYNSNAEKPKERIEDNKDQIDIQLLIKHTRNKKKNLKEQQLKKKNLAKQKLILEYNNKNIISPKSTTNMNIKEVVNNETHDTIISKGNIKVNNQEDITMNENNQSKRDSIIKSMNSQRSQAARLNSSADILDAALVSQSNKEKPNFYNTKTDKMNAVKLDFTPNDTKTDDYDNTLGTKTDIQFNFTNKQKLKPINPEEFNKRVEKMSERVSNLNENNTINLVKKEIISGCHLKQTFEKKKENLEQIMKLKIQSAKDVERKIQEKAKFNKTAKNLQVNQDMYLTQDNFKKQNLFREYYRTAYEEKKKTWREQDKVIENKEKEELQRVRENRLLINNIRKRPRFDNLYSDQYSNRHFDDNINNLIKRFNSELGRKAYDKRMLNFKVDEFLKSFNVEAPHLNSYDY